MWIGHLIFIFIIFKCKIHSLCLIYNKYRVLNNKDKKIMIGKYQKHLLEILDDSNAWKIGLWW